MRFDPSTIRVESHIGDDLLWVRCLLSDCDWRMTFSFGAQRLSTVTEVCEQHPCKGERHG